MQLSLLQQSIINQYQKGFPLVSAPYEYLAKELHCSEADVLAAFESLDQQDILSRVGPVFDHKKAGASTLAALAVPSEQLDKIAGIVNQFDQVNHNYEREHHYNLWFVVTAKDPIALNAVLERIEALTGFSILVLPMEASYHIDLSFDVNFDTNTHTKANEKLNIDVHHNKALEC